MDKIFAEMFAKQPDEIIEGDYFYHIQWLADIFAECKMHSKFSIEGVRNWRFNQVKINFKDRWAQSTVHDENIIHYNAWLDDTFKEAIIKTALDNKPFMDIASGEGMGLAPYIVDLNPQIPCLITDIDAQAIKTLRSCADEHLKEYNINFAAFNDCDIPIKDDSLDCITSRYGISSSHGKPADKPRISYNYQNFDGTEKVIAEAYRVLKPGGSLITVEPNMEFDFDLQKIYNDYNENGRLFGVYTYDEIQTVCEVLTEQPWRDKFTAAGFRVEIEKKHYRRYPINEIKKFLYDITYLNKMREWTDEERVLYAISENNIKHMRTKQAINEMRETETLFSEFHLLNDFTKIEDDCPRKLSAQEVRDILYKMAESEEIKKYLDSVGDHGEREDIGLDIFGVDTFYVLRKPE